MCFSMEIFLNEKKIAWIVGNFPYSINIFFFFFVVSFLLLISADAQLSLLIMDFFPFYSIAANQAWARAHQKKTKKEYNQILFWRMRFFFLYLFHKAYSRNCKDLSSQFPLKNSYSSENSWVFYACIGESSIFSWINFPSTVSSNSNVGKAVVHAIFNKGRVLFWLDVEIRMLLFRSNHFAWYILHDRKCSWKIVSHQYHYYQPTLTHTIT